MITKDDLYDPVYFQVGFLNQIPHKKQKEVLRHPAKHKVICCGRRAGKTQMVAGEIIRGSYLDLFHKQGAIAPNYKHLRTLYNKIIEILGKCNKLGILKSYTLSPTPKIIFNNGAYIDFVQTDNPVTIRSEAYDRTFEDEANYIKDEAQSAIRPMRWDTGAPSWKTSTPDIKNSFYTEYTEGLSNTNPDRASFHYDYRDNPYLDEEGIKEIEAEIEMYGIDSLYVQQEIFGNFTEDRDMYFSEKLINKILVDFEFFNRYQDLIPFNRNEKAEYILGLDIARFGGDSTVFIVLEKQMYGPDRKIRPIYIEEMTKTSGDVVVAHTKLLQEKFKFNKVYIDETGLGGPIVDMLKHALGYILEPITFTIDSKQDLYSNLNILFHQELIELPQSHKKLIYQLRDMRYEKIGDKSGEGRGFGKIKIHHSQGGHDDFSDTLALACFYFKPGIKKASFHIA